MYANPQRAPSSFGIVRLSNEIKYDSQSRFISDSTPSVGCKSFEERMGAAGFSPREAFPPISRFAGVRPMAVPALPPCGDGRSPFRPAGRRRCRAGRACGGANPSRPSPLLEASSAWKPKRQLRMGIHQKHNVHRWRGGGSPSAARVCTSDSAGGTTPRCHCVQGDVPMERDPTPIDPETAIESYLQDRSNELSPNTKPSEPPHVIHQVVH